MKKCTINVVVPADSRCDESCQRGTENRRSASITEGGGHSTGAFHHIPSLCPVQLVLDRLANPKLHHSYTFLKSSSLTGFSQNACHEFRRRRQRQFSMRSDLRSVNSKFSPRRRSVKWQIQSNNQLLQALQPRVPTPWLHYSEVLPRRFCSSHILVP